MENFEIQVPDYFEELVGYRAWLVVQQGSMVRLASLMTQHPGMAVLWKPGEWMEAECKRVNLIIATLAKRSSMLPCKAKPGERLPAQACSCGFYAARDREHLIRLGYQKTESEYPAGPVAQQVGVKCLAMGEVGMAGKVLVHTQGYRAEMVRARELWLPHTQWKLAEPLEQTYGIKVNLGNFYRAA